MRASPMIVRMHLHQPSASYDPTGDVFDTGRREFDMLQDVSSMFQALASEHVSTDLARMHLAQLRKRLDDFETTVLPIIMDTEK